MTRIARDNQVITLINVFTVEPGRQQDLLNLLTEATEQVIRALPGFVSANLHRGLDGRTVANYAQWRSQADLEAMLVNPAAQAHLKEAGSMATAEPHLYVVTSTHE